MHCFKLFTFINSEIPTTIGVDSIISPTWTDKEKEA